MKTLSILFLFLLCGCNNLSEQVGQHVDNKIETSKQDMNAEVQKLKQGFVAIYTEKLKSQADSHGKKRLQSFYNSVLDTDIYLDSLKSEMDKLDEKDVNNVELVKTTFLYRGAGDSIINKMKASIAAAQNCVNTERQKNAIKTESDTLFNVTDETWKEQTFGLTNPLSASMILYGLRTELYYIGVKALSDN